MNKIILFKKLLYIFILLLGIVAFSTSSLIGFVFTCGKHFCYYNNCYNYHFDIRMECFINKINNISDWIILDLISFLIIFSIGILFLLFRKIFNKINKCFIDYKNKYHFLNSSRYNKSNNYNSSNSSNSSNSYNISNNSIGNNKNNENNDKTIILFNELKVIKNSEKESLEIEEYNPLLIV